MTYRVPIEGEVFVQADSAEEAREKVERWFQAFPPVEEKTGVLTHRMVARRPQEADARQIPAPPADVARE